MTDRHASFTFAKITPRVTGQLRAAGWTDGTPIVVAEPDDPISAVLQRVADANDGAHGRALLVFADEGHPDLWHGVLVPASTFIIRAPREPR